MVAQVVLAVTVGDGPVRFGAPVPERALVVGLSLRGDGAFAWRPLPLRRCAGRCWVEVLLCARPGVARIELGGSGPCPETGNAAVAMSTVSLDDGRSERREWHWSSGPIDWRERTLFAAETVVGDEVFGGDEWRTVESPQLAGRCAAALTLPRRVWESVGLLPADEHLAGGIRSCLQRAAHALVELPGCRGAGDHARSDGIVTNLEFDTTLALLRLAIALGDADLLARARRAAMHLVDRDLDRRTGLPFPHGLGHREGTPEPGHAWLQGLTWVGAIAAEPHLLNAARQIASGLGATPPAGEHERERARDYAWPLLELEAWLQFADDPVAAAAASAFAAAIAARFDTTTRTFRFGEGEVRGPGYFERGWLTGGVVVPALQAHLRRVPQPALQAIVDAATAALLARIGQGRDGLPTHWRVLPGSTFAEHRAEHDPMAFLLLEALPRRDLLRLLHRPHVLRGLLDTPALDDPDLPTSLAMAARCTWVYR